MWPRVLWLNGLNFLIASHLFAKFGGLRPSGSSDKAAKIVYVTLREHLIKESGDFMEGNSSLCILTLPKLITIDIEVMDI